MKPLNKNVQFVKLKKDMTSPIGISYRVKSFGDKESIVIVDKKATTFNNNDIYQDMDCYKADQQVKITRSK